MSHIQKNCQFKSQLDQAGFLLKLLSNLEQRADLELIPVGVQGNTLFIK